MEFLRQWPTKETFAAVACGCVLGIVCWCLKINERSGNSWFSPSIPSEQSVMFDTADIWKWQWKDNEKDNARRKRRCKYIQNIKKKNSRPLHTNTLLLQLLISTIFKPLESYSRIIIDLPDRYKLTRNQVL